MKAKGRTIKYIFRVLKDEGVDFSDIRERLPEEYKNLITDINALKDEELFPFEMYMEIMKLVCFEKGREFARFIGKKSAELFISGELRVAKRIKDVQWIISKDFLIGDSFYGGCRYLTKRLSENEINVKFENMDKTNEFVEEKIRGFLEEIFNTAGLKTEVSIVSSPLKGSPFLEINVKW
jgi:hypothetical protein